MRIELLYTIAIDEYGNSVHIDKAQKGLKYFCPECKNEFILRKSGKTGKGSRRAHFAHNTSENCNRDDYLHSSFQILLLEKMKECLKNGSPLVITWKCNYCKKEHSANLLGGVFDIKHEYDMKICRPDIALINEKGNVLTVIELINTHKPEEYAVNHYKNNNIVLIKILLDSLEDLEKIEIKIKNPSEVDFCFNMLKQNYSQIMLKDIMIAAYVLKNKEYYHRREQIRRKKNRF